MSQWCHSLQKRGMNHWDKNSIWLYFPPPSSLRHLLSLKSSFVTLLRLICPPHPLGLHLQWFFCPFSATCFPCLYLFIYLFLPQRLCFTFIFSLCYSLFNPHNKPFLVYFLLLFIHLLHWPFAPMPVSVWVLCQPLCQDRSPSTPASGGREGETGRAHCHCWTGVVLQLGILLYHDRRLYG